MGRVFANGPGDVGSTPSRIIPKTLKMVLDTSLLKTQQYKVRINDKVEQSKEWSSAFTYTSVLKLLKREPSGRPRLWSPTLLTNLELHYLDNEEMLRDKPRCELLKDAGNYFERIPKVAP